MTLFSRAAASISERRGANPSLPWGDSTPPPPGYTGGAIGGGPMSQGAALQIAAVYGAVGLLSDSVATLPIRLLDSPVLSNAREIKPSTLITQPYSQCSRFDWFVQAITSLALRGNFYGQIIERDKDLYPQQIKPISPDSVTVRRDQSGRIEYRFFNQVVDTRDVFHIRNISAPGMLVGLNPIEIMRYPLGIAAAQEAYGESYFRNSAMPLGVIQVEGDLAPNETKSLLRNWLSSHQGINQANLPAVLTGGAKFTPVTITPEDSQFLQSRAFSQSQITGMIFRCPPHKLGIADKSTTWGRGLEQLERGFVADALQPYLSRVEEALTPLHPPGQYVNFYLEHRVRGDTLQRAQAGSLMMLAGAWCADDVRARFDMPPVPDGKGQEFYVPINTELLQAALAQVQAAQAAEDQPNPPTSEKI